MHFAGESSLRFEIKFKEVFSLTLGEDSQVGSKKKINK